MDQLSNEPTGELVHSGHDQPDIPLPAINEKEVPLAKLKTELAELMKFRGDPELNDDERAAIDSQVKLYVEANLRKVDNVRQWWRYAEDMLESAKQDHKDSGKRVSEWDGKLEFIKQLCADTMIAFDEKKLEGEHGFIRLQANGGPVALDIHNSSLIPEPMVAYQGAITSAAWTEICEACMAVGVNPLKLEGVKMERVPLLDKIRRELEANCTYCGGTGIGGDGPAVGDTAAACGECNGTGKRLVPGARLGVRGKHARIR